MNFLTVIQKVPIGLTINNRDMSEKEFIDWLRGFTEGVHHYNLTPKQWDHLKDKLSRVNKEVKNSYTIDSNYWTTSW